MRRPFPLLVACLALTVLAATATGCSSGGGSADESTPVLFSTDLAMGLTTGDANGSEDYPPDVDDAWAFALAAAHDQLDLRGLVVTMGNSLVAPELKATRATAEALGSDSRVVEGAPVWLSVAPLRDYAGASLASTCVNDGVRFMADELRRTDGLTIVAIGPLTDLACLAMNFPEQAARIKRIVALVGSKPVKALKLEGHVVRDFNYALDPRAEEVLLKQTRIPFTAIMFQASSSARIPVSEITAMAKSDDALARFFGRASTPYAEFWKSAIGPEKPLWDANVVWYLLHPDAYRCGPAGYRLQTGSPNAGSDVPITDWFSPKYTDTRQVTACSAFSGPEAIDRFNAAVLAAVGAP
jgi:inosine-uridine nucleoside N-ribohydrolase